MCARCVMWCGRNCSIIGLRVLCVRSKVCKCSDLPCSTIPRSWCAKSKMPLSCGAVIAGGILAFLRAVYEYLLGDTAILLRMRSAGLEVPCVESLESEMSKVIRKS